MGLSEGPLLTPADIHAEFERVRGAVDFRSVADPDSLTQPAFDTPRLDSPQFYKRLAPIAKILESHPRFAERFDFWWATEPESYTSPAETGLQTVLIAALADAVQDHPNLRRLKPTVIRCVANPQFSSLSIRGSEVDFVCISTGFMKFLQMLLGSLIDFHDAGKDLAGPTRICATNVVFGQDAERTLRQRPQAGKEICGRIVDQALKVFGGGLAGHHSPIFGRMLGDISEASPLMPALYVACEGFITLHELAHLLAGHEYSASRSLEHEIEADLSGISLMIVASSVLGDSLSVPVLYGPPLFFQGARLYALIHRIGVLYAEKDLPESEQQSIDTLAAAERELKHRLGRTQRYLHEQVPLPAGVPDIFGSIVSELAVPIVGCQQKLFAMTGRELEFDATLDAVNR